MYAIKIFQLLCIIKDVQLDIQYSQICINKQHAFNPSSLQILLILAIYVFIFAFGKLILH